MMHSNEPLGISLGFTVLITACSSVGAVFTGAHGLHVVSLLAAFGTTITGITAVANVSQTASNSAMLGIMAGTSTVLATAFALSATTKIPFGLLALLVLIPAAIWFALWAKNRAYTELPF